MTQFDFGYAWPWTYGHLYLAIAAALLGLAAWRLRWPRWISIPAAVLALYAFAGFLIIHFVFRFNLPVPIPTTRFLASGEGKVLDVGSGSGRAALAVLLARPRTSVVALDNFSADYIRGNSPDLIHRNARAAGVDSRLSVQPGDMRAMPLESASFDGVISTYAIDHLDGPGQVKALAEVARVLRPGGEFLLLVIRRDMWMNVVFPSFVGMHSHGRRGPTWRQQIENAGLAVTEVGTAPGTLYVLASKPPR